MTLIDFEDAVDASHLDPNATHAVYYADGAFANRAAVAARCPHAKLYAITVHGLTGPGIFACDSETGDLTVPETEAWVAEQVRLGVRLICVYANLNRWLNEGLKAALDKYGHRIRRWVADWNNVPQIPSWADADQFFSDASVDKDVAVATFFGDDQPAPAGPTGKANAAVQIDFHTWRWIVHKLPGTFRGAPPGRWASAEVQINVDTGEWRIRQMPFNAKPLGG